MKELFIEVSMVRRSHFVVFNLNSSQIDELGNWYLKG